MQRRPSTSPREMSSLDTDELRSRFLLDDLFTRGHVTLVQLSDDRMIIGGIEIAGDSVPLAAPEELGSTHFCERHELAVVSLRGGGVVDVDGRRHELARFDLLYVGRGARTVSFSGDDRLYLVASPADRDGGISLVSRDAAATLALGDAESSNDRVIRKYLHDDGVSAARLVVGITELAPGSVWNTMPPHLHSRRTEVYLYTGLAPEGRVVHLCGEPEATRSLIVANDEAVVAPPWSIHSGAGTSSYAFVWAMSGENTDYTDVEPVPVGRLR